MSNILFAFNVAQEVDTLEDAVWIGTGEAQANFHCTRG